ncbi:MAG: putative baseplate assembly protein [Methylobacter sp.]
MKSKMEACGCCEGIEIVTPEPTANRPGLAALSYRIGTHATFLETMLARLLSSRDYPKLAELTTREAEDPSIAILDAWATVADVLTFYNERLINEGYLRTATERRSILELARLVGYRLRPGVASSVYLAYVLDENFKNEVIIPKGARSQSMPLEPGELPQSFETSEDLKARAKWNNLRPRNSRPQTKFSMLLDAKGPRIYLKGINTNLKPNDALLIDFGGDNHPSFYRVKEAIPIPADDRSLVLLQTKTERFDQVGDLLDVFNKNIKVKIILLDSGDGLPGFFALPDNDNPAGVITLVSVRDGSHWAMEVGRSEQDELNTIRLIRDQTNKEFFYNVETVEKVEQLEEVKSLNGNANFMPYFRISLQRVQEYSDLLTALSSPPSVQPANGLRLQRSLAEQFVGPASSAGASAMAKRSNLHAGAPVQINASGSVQGLVRVAEASNAVVKKFAPILSDNLAVANANAEVTNSNPIKVYALRVKASMFGSNAPDVPSYSRDDHTGMVEVDHYDSPVPIDVWSDLIDIENYEGMKTVAADTQLEHTLAGSWLVIDRPKFNNPRNLNESFGRSMTVHNIQNNQLVTKSALGVPSKVSLLALDKPWLDKLEDDEKDVSITSTDNGLLFKSTTLLRSTNLYAQSEELELAEEPVTDFICGGRDDLIELDGYYEDLQAGSWAFVSGERADVSATTGVKSSELAMVSAVGQDIGHQSWYVPPLEAGPVNITLPGDKVHTFIKLAEPLQYCFKRDGMVIYGNVVKATHGETRQEVLGSGDAAKALQSFTLRQPPITYVAASNPSGVDSTLKVYVNDIEWHETEALAGLLPKDRNFVTKIDNEGKTTLIFGNGREGARPPTGIENIRAVYRNGIGKPGNANAGQINMLITRPLGVKEVTNPLRASGGADKESRDQARKNAPLAVKALDRLVSVQDYEDFTRMFAGIGKARAIELSNGRRQVVQVTIAGADDIPIDKNNDLYRNLRQALLDNGDPFQALQLDVRELMLIVIDAGIRILPDYLWEPVVTQVRTALLDTFSFERRELGQDVLLSEVISVIQAVRGVAYVDVDKLRGIPEKIVDQLHGGQRRLLTPAEIADVVSQSEDKSESPIEDPLPRIPVYLAGRLEDTIYPAQLAFLAPEIPATLNLKQIA